MRGLERHIYSCVYAFWPYLEELSVLQPEVGSESWYFFTALWSHPDMAVHSSTFRSLLPLFGMVVGSEGASLLNHYTAIALICA